MAWIDDRIWCHPKLTDVTGDAAWLWVKSVTYSTGFQTRGHLTSGQQRTIGATRKTRGELITAGLWDDDGSGAVQIHDWDEHNSRRDARRAADRDRKKRQRVATDGTTLKDSDWVAARQRVFARDRGVCVDCGGRDTHWHADHVPSREALRTEGIDLCDISFIETRCTSCHGKRTNPHATSGRGSGRTSGRPPRTARVDGSEGSEGTTSSTKAVPVARPAALATTHERPGEITSVKHQITRSLKEAS